MPTVNSLVTRLGFGAQTVKGTYPITPVQLARASSIESIPNFDRIENQNHMIGVSDRSSSRQSLPVRSGISVPLNLEVYAYPLSLAYVLFGTGFVPATGVTATGITTYKFVKSLPQEAPYLTTYLRSGSGSQGFTRQIKDCRFSSAELTLNRQGSTWRLQGMGLNETGIANAGITVTSELPDMFLPFLGGMVWDTAVTGGSAFDFGIGREHTITFTRPIEEDDQLLHNFGRNDNQEMSFEVGGQIRGLDFTSALYSALVYNNVGSMIGASPSAITVLSGMTIELNTAANIPAATATYKFILNIPRAEINMDNFRYQGNDMVRADVTWTMIDDQVTPPVRIEITNNVTSYPYSNSLFVNGGGTSWTLPDATP